MLKTKTPGLASAIETLANAALAFSRTSAHEPALHAAAIQYAHELVCSLKPSEILRLMMSGQGLDQLTPAMAYQNAPTSAQPAPPAASPTNTPASVQSPGAPMRASLEVRPAGLRRLFSEPAPVIPPEAPAQKEHDRAALERIAAALNRRNIGDKNEPVTGRIADLLADRDGLGHTLDALNAPEHKFQANRLRALVSELHARIPQEFAHGRGIKERLASVVSANAAQTARLKEIAAPPCPDNFTDAEADKLGAPAGGGGNDRVRRLLAEIFAAVSAYHMPGTIVDKLAWLVQRSESMRGQLNEHKARLDARRKHVPRLNKNTGEIQTVTIPSLVADAIKSVYQDTGVVVGGHPSKVEAILDRIGQRVHAWLSDYGFLASNVKRERLIPSNIAADALLDQLADQVGAPRGASKETILGRTLEKLGARDTLATGELADAHEVLTAVFKVATRPMRLNAPAYGLVTRIRMLGEERDNRVADYRRCAEDLDGVRAELAACKRDRQAFKEASFPNRIATPAGMTKHVEVPMFRTPANIIEIVNKAYDEHISSTFLRRAGMSVEQEDRKYKLGQAIKTALDKLNPPVSGARTVTVGEQPGVAHVQPIAPVKSGEMVVAASPTHEALAKEINDAHAALTAAGIFSGQTLAFRISEFVRLVKLEHANEDQRRGRLAELEAQRNALRSELETLKGVTNAGSWSTGDKFWAVLTGDPSWGNALDYKPGALVCVFRPQNVSIDGHPGELALALANVERLTALLKDTTEPGEHPWLREVEDALTAYDGGNNGSPGARIHMLGTRLCKLVNMNTRISAIFNSEKGS